MQNIERIIEVMTQIVKSQLESASGADMGTFIEIMNVMTYLKIVCT